MGSGSRCVVLQGRGVPGDGVWTDVEVSFWQHPARWRDRLDRWALRASVLSVVSDQVRVRDVRMIPGYPHWFFPWCRPFAPSRTFTSAQWPLSPAAELVNRPASRNRAGERGTARARRLNPRRSWQVEHERPAPSHDVTGFPLAPSGLLRGGTERQSLTGPPARGGLHHKSSPARLAPVLLIQDTTSGCGPLRQRAHGAGPRHPKAACQRLPITTSETVGLPAGSRPRGRRLVTHTTGA